MHFVSIRELGETWNGVADVEEGVVCCSGITGWEGGGVCLLTYFDQGGKKGRGNIYFEVGWGCVVC